MREAFLEARSRRPPSSREDPSCRREPRERHQKHRPMCLSAGGASRQQDIVGRYEPWRVRAGSEGKGARHSNRSIPSRTLRCRDSSLAAHYRVRRRPACRHDTIGDCPCWGPRAPVRGIRGDDPHLGRDLVSWPLLVRATGSVVAARSFEVDMRAARRELVCALIERSAPPAKVTRSSPCPGEPSSAPAIGKRALPDALVVAVASVTSASFDSRSSAPCTALTSPFSSVVATASTESASPSMSSVDGSGSNRRVTDLRAGSSGRRPSCRPIEAEADAGTSKWAT